MRWATKRTRKGAGAALVLVAGGGVYRAADQGVFPTGRGPAYEPWGERLNAKGPMALVSAAILAFNAHNLHALQALPLVGWLGTGRRLALVLISGLAYLGFVLLLTWQALRGQPAVAPDATMLFALLAVAGAAAVLVMLGGRRETVFSLSTIAVAPFWVLMILLPRRPPRTKAPRGRHALTGNAGLPYSKMCRRGTIFEAPLGRGGLCSR